MVGGLEHFLFYHIFGIIIPFDSYFSEGSKPPTRDVIEHILFGNQTWQWKIPELNGGFNRKITFFYGPFSIASYYLL